MTASGLPSYLTKGNPHSPVPLRGTYVREADGSPADLMNGADYPVAAECKICGGRIRLGHLMQWDWRHAPAPVAVPEGDAAC